MHPPQQIVVVDDHDDSRELVRALLEWAGCEVAAFGTAQGALARLRAGGVSALVTDIRLPDLSGIELALAARALPGGASLTIVALTGVHELPSTPFDAALHKPFRADDLFAALGVQPADQSRIE
jgi:CheY-like chemotaxis protein